MQSANDSIKILVDNMYIPITLNNKFKSLIVIDIKLCLTIQMLYIFMYMYIITNCKQIIQVSRDEEKKEQVW